MPTPDLTLTIRCTYEALAGLREQKQQMREQKQQMQDKTKAYRYTAMAVNPETGDKLCEVPCTVLSAQEQDDDTRVGRLAVSIAGEHVERFPVLAATDPCNVLVGVYLLPPDITEGPF